MFSYIARDPAGQKVTGQLAGASELAVLAELQTRRLAPLEVRIVPEHGAAGSKPGIGWRRRISTRHLATVYRQLADLLRAGVPLLKALRLVGRGKSAPRLSQVMSSIADSVADGARLGDAMAVHEAVFPPIHVAMIRAGERGGFLEQVFGRLGSFLEQQADLKSKVIGNLLYPAILLTVGVGVIIGALVFFVPQFRRFYVEIDVPLPTTILLATSSLVTNHGLLLLAAIVVAAVMGWRWLRRPGMSRKLAAWRLRLPYIGSLTRNLAVGRFARVLGTLLGNGIPMLAAMQISRDAAGHPLMAEAIDRASEAVRAGESLAQPLGASGLVDDDVLEMIAVGESANNLPEVLITIAETIEKRVDRSLTLMVRLMEPALLFLLGGMVAFIFLALLIPMMRLGSAL